MHIVAATGLHQAGHYRAEKLVGLVDGLAERFIAELGEGMRLDEEPDGAGLSARAGLIEVAGDFHHVGRHASVEVGGARAADAGRPPPRDRRKIAL